VTLELRRVVGLFKNSLHVNVLCHATLKFCCGHSKFTSDHYLNMPRVFGHHTTIIMLIDNIEAVQRKSTNRQTLRFISGGHLATFPTAVASCRFTDGRAPVVATLYRTDRVLRCCRQRQWENQSPLGLLTARWPSTRDWRWPSTASTRRNWVSRAPTTSNSSTSVVQFRLPGPILSVFPALIVHSELKSVHPGFPVAFIF